MTEAEHDQLAGEVFANAKGALWLATIEHRFPYLHAEIGQRLRRMRALWQTGAPSEATMPESRQSREEDEAPPVPVDPDADVENAAEQAVAEAEAEARGR